MFDFSIILPTYRRPDVLDLCLQHLCALDYPGESFEVRVYDNGGDQDSRAVVKIFQDRLRNLSYTLNPPGQGLGFSLARGSSEATGRYIVELNDDAIVPTDLLQRFRQQFETDPKIGVIGVRAIEDGYVDDGGDVGTIDANSGTIHGNFVRELSTAIDVEHVYGFCYTYRSEILKRGCLHDQTLLAKNYSSGNRIETDHCLSARRAGFRVVYDGTLAVQHLAKPRADMDERSLRWRLNHVRNTLYLFLKHYGIFGRKGLAFRFASTHDIGLRSALFRPTMTNLRYLANSMRARASAFGHYAIYRLQQWNSPFNQNMRSTQDTSQNSPPTKSVNS